MAAAKKKVNLDDMFDDDLTADREVIPIGVKCVDPRLGGGLPTGVLVEAYGPSGSGKTSFGYSHIAEHQQLGNISVLFDAERSWNPSMGARYGIDTEHTVKLKGKPEKTFRMSAKSEIKIMEVLFSRIKLMLENMPEVRFIMVDSAAALMCQSVADKKAGDQRNTDAMDNARVFSACLKDLDMWIAENGNNTTVYFVNHEKEVIGFGGYGPPKTDTPLGKALKFYASYRLQFRQVKVDKIEIYDPVTKQTIKKEDKLYIRVQAVKNRYYPPFRPATFVFDVGGGTGIDPVRTTLAHALAQGLITPALKEPEMGKNGKPKKPEEKKGYWAVPPEWSAEGEAVEIHGMTQLTAYYEQNTETFTRLEEYVASHLEDSESIVVSDVDDEDENPNMLDLSKV